MSQELAEGLAVGFGQIEQIVALIPAGPRALQKRGVPRPGAVLAGLDPLFDIVDRLVGLVDLLCRQHPGHHEIPGQIPKIALALVHSLLLSQRTPSQYSTR